MRIGFKNWSSKMIFFFIYLTQINFVCFFCRGLRGNELKKLPQGPLFISHYSPKEFEDLSWFGNAE